MEENILKLPVFDTKTVFDKTAEQPIDADFTLPEYYPDIDRILKCTAIPFVVSKGTNGANITVEGTVKITVIYVDDQNELNSYEYSYPFQKNFETENAQNIYCITANAKTEYLNCRAVSERKVDIHGALLISLTVSEKTAMEIISDLDIPDIESKRESIEATSPVGCFNKYLSVEEDIEIGSTQKEINCIIRYSATPYVSDCKLMQNKTMVKGELAVNMLYCNNDGELLTLKENLPFSALVETDAVTESCKCETDAELSFLEIKPKSNADGVLRSFSIDAKVLLTVKTYCESEFEAVLDAYSRKYATEITKKEITLCKLSDKISDTFTAKSNIEIENGKLVSVTDIWCSVKSDTSKAENGKYILSGTVCVNILGIDTDQSPVYIEREYPFEFEREIKSADELLAFSRIGVKNCGFTLLAGGDVEIRAELSLNASLYKCKRINVVTDVTINRDKPIEKPKKCAMVIYFAAAGESVWDIAMRYLSDVEEIKKINGISDETLLSDKTILIPIK